MRNYKITGVLLLLAALAIFLPACSDNRAEIAVSYLDALNARDLQAALDYACAERADEIANGLLSVAGGAEEAFGFNSISCTPRGDEVMCRFTISQLTDANENTGVQRTRQVVFDFEDGKICGFEEQVANDP